MQAKISIKNKERLKVIQITDTHVFANKTQTLQGHCTYKNLSETIDYVLAFEETPDFVLLTGDISQDESSDSYHLARAQLERLNLPVYWIHGNHDDETKVRPIFDMASSLEQLKHLMTSFWDFIAINTCRQGTDEGHLEESELADFWQKVTLAKNNNKNIVVVVHHHPHPVTTPLVDACMLQKADDFLVQIKQHPEIKLIICGHVHGDYRISYGDQMIEACPATSFQWKKGTSTLSTQDERGFKRFTFYPTTYQASAVFL